MRRLTSKPIKHLRFRRPDDIMNPMNLIELILARKKRFLGDQLKQHTPKSPNIHLLIVVPISHQALGSPVPTCRYVISIRCGTVLALA